MLISLLLSLLFIQEKAFAWGEVGHELVAEFGDSLANPDALKNCGLTGDQVVLHTNDPDKIWKQKRGQYRNEAMAHYFHVDWQEGDWKKATKSEDIRKNGFLVYRIADWFEEAKALRKAKKMDELHEKLYGLSHYLGDLTQPLHLYSDHDGVRAGVKGVHSQFETKMINRYRAEVREQVARLTKENKIPEAWTNTDFRTLVFNTAEQSSRLAPQLLELSKASLEPPRSRRQHKPSFIKKILWQKTGSMAVQRLALGARLWGQALNLICSGNP